MLGNLGTGIGDTFQCQKEISMNLSQYKFGCGAKGQIWLWIICSKDDFRFWESEARNQADSSLLSDWHCFPNMNNRIRNIDICIVEEYKKPQGSISDTVIATLELENNMCYHMFRYLIGFKQGQG